MTGSVASAGVEEAFAQHRRQLHVHCYRMLASFDEAEEAVQEAFLRAWRARDGFDGENARAWLYRIATNVCLDLLRARNRRLRRVESFAELGWLQPYPDRLLDEAGPDAVAVERETIELAFLAALQALAPRQRAALVARDVLGWSAAETAQLLATSVPAVNSALQRARARLRERLPAERGEWPSRPTPGEKEILARFIDAHERMDTETVLAMAARDIRVTMPPDGLLFQGTEALMTLLRRAFGPDREGDWRLVPVAANRMPAAASYLRRPGDSRFRAFKLDVIRVVDGSVAEVTTFGASRFASFALTSTL